MVKPGRSRAVGVIWLLILFVFITVLPAQGADEPLDFIPAESLFCVRVNNFDYTLGQLDQFLTGVLPLPMGVSMMVRMQLANITGNPQIPGVDMSGHFAAFGTVLPGEAAQPVQSQHMFVGILVPVTDYSQFIQASPNITSGDDKGISRLTVASAPPAPGQSVAPDVKQLGFTARLGNYALVNLTTDYDVMVKAIQMLADAKTTRLSAVLDAGQKKTAKEKAVWAHANIQAVSKNFGPAFFAELEQVKGRMASAGSVEGAPNLGSMMNVYFDFIKSLMNETKSVSATLEPRPDALKVRAEILSVPGTEMASMFIANTEAGENKLFGYLEDGAIMNFALNTNAPFWNKLAVKSVDLVCAMTGGTMGDEEKAEMKKLTADAMASLGGPFAGSVSIDMTNTPPFVLRYVSAVKDEKELNRVIDEYVKMYESGRPLANLSKEMGLAASFKISRGVETYNGVSIDQVIVKTTSTDPNSQQGQMITAMYGGGLKYKWAIVDGLLVCAMGPDGDSRLRKLIDIVKAGGPKETASEIKQALALLPGAERRDFFATYNLVRMFKMAGSFAPAAMPQTDIPSSGNFVFAGGSADGRLTIDIALPKTHLVEFMTMMQMVMMQQMQQQGQRPMSIPMPPQQ